MRQSTHQALLRQIPAVDQVLLRPLIAAWVERTGRSLVVSEIQALLQEVRDGIRSGDETYDRAVGMDNLELILDQRLRARLRPQLLPVINATGVILHTNLGRAPLSTGAQESLSAVSGHYANLEFDLATGERSYRDKLLEGLLGEILGSEAATVVNNNAAAVFLILNTLASGKEVVVSRGELIEIGGSFRIPDILARSGAVLREVGTTNKTRIQDYEAAIGRDTALFLRVHPSNYRIRGFTERPGLSELLDLAHRHEVPVVEDIGSGLLADLSRFGITEEPIAQKSITAGVDLVCFSGDKLLGGPQAGIIAGSRKWIEPIRKNPLMRTYRVEKLIYGALEGTLAAYRAGRALEEIPVLMMISISPEELQRRSRRFVRRLKPRLPASCRIELFKGHSVVGGGSCPGSELPTTLLALESARYRAHVIEARLRSQSPPVILRLEEDRALLDLRTVFPSQEDLLLSGIAHALE
ncbi:MAG: L-seryl-tRNA(Sec) selenium transferase [Acidobacteria bacterium]|nr:MAG: L-seryl-tRNA(Sec) selenium transferase [Acidobacteriota bacterium]